MFATIALALVQGTSPSAQPSNQQLIDVAPPGSVVHLRNEHLVLPWEGGSLLIDKPLTVLGNGATFKNIRILGPGQGEVVLHGVELRHPHYCVNRCDPVFDWLEVHGLLDGAFEIDGFDSVRIYDSSADGVSIFGRVGSLAFTRCEFSGAQNWHGEWYLGPPPTYLWDTRLNDGFHNSLPNDLAMTGSGRLGTVLELDWRTFTPPGGVGLLYADFGVRTPRPAGSGTWNFLGDTPLFLYIGRRMAVPVLTERSLIGLEVTFQARDLGGRYSSPQFALLRP